MEEQVGQIWHKFITRMADKNYPKAAIKLADIKKTISIYFHALGGNNSLGVTQADAGVYNSKRGLLKRIARSEEKVEFAWVDENSLKLPKVIDYFPTKTLNKDLYFWLAALASVNIEDKNWFTANQLRTQKVLKIFPGLEPRYKKLLKAHLELRPDKKELKDKELEIEKSICKALLNPNNTTKLAKYKYKPYPVVLWLHPNPPIVDSGDKTDYGDSDNKKGDKQKDASDIGKKQAKRVEKDEENKGLITIRMENIFTWGEFVNVDRSTDENEDEDNAKEVAKDLDKLAITRNQKASKIQMKFDLDLPSESMDDEVLESGILLPEWDWKQQKLLENRCNVVSMVAKGEQNIDLPEHLKATAKKLKNQFQAITPARVWHNKQTDGQEVDLDAYLKYKADTLAGNSSEADDLFKELNSGSRDLSCLLLADLSLSTDTWVNNNSRVIDIIRDSLYLFAESLSTTGDRFGIYGFSSRKRDPIRVHTLKAFDETYNGKIRGRISEIKPGYYTRMGAGIRHSANLLKDQVATQQLLLILTDGKPNDLDMYEGRYGIEDTKHAVIEARKLGLKVFCVTIDEKAGDYLPNLFGSNGYILVKKISDLPKSLPLLYARLVN